MRRARGWGGERSEGMGMGDGRQRSADDLTPVARASCGRRRKQGGQPCKRAAVRPGWPCLQHGGAALLRKVALGMIRLPSESSTCDGDAADAPAMSSPLDGKRRKRKRDKPLIRKG